MVDESPDRSSVIVIACQVFRDLLERHLPDDLSDRVKYLDYDLHNSPVRIGNALQNAIDSVTTPSLIALGYGLCGNGLDGIKSRNHTLLIPCVDDCIAMLLGSHEAYIREFEAVPGTYYLSKGWLESESHPLKEYEECVKRYGEENARWIMDRQYQNYRRLVFVAHDRSDLEAYRDQAKEVAQFCQRWDMRYEEILGSDSYVRRLVEVALDPDRIGDDFVLVPPGGEVCIEQFLR
jgi:hypothetical protein